VSPGGAHHLLVREHLSRLVEPVRGEQQVQLRDDGAVEAGHGLLPVQPATDVGALVVMGGDHVLAAHPARLPVDDHHLAVVAQVGTLEGTIAERLDRHHRVVLDPVGVEATAHGPVVAEVAEGAPVVVQHPHRDPASGGLGESGEEVLGDLVEHHDVEQHVHAFAGGADIGGHPGDRAVVVDLEIGGVVAGQREGAQFTVQPHRGLQPAGHVLVELAVGDPLRAHPHQTVDDRLLRAALAGQLGLAQQQVQREADDREHHDRQQPRQRRSRPAVARHHDDPDDAQGHVQSQEAIGAHHHPVVQDPVPEGHGVSSCS